MEPTSSSRCLATKSNGRPCQAPPSASGYCFAHDPQLRAKTAEARKQGGRNSSNTARARKRMGAELQDIVKMVEAALGGVYKGSLTPQQGSALASLAGAWLRLHEMAEVEGRIEELEARLETRQAQRRY